MDGRVSGSKGVNGSTTKGGIMLHLGTGRSFSIADIVGAENIGNYTVENFFVVHPTVSGQTGSVYRGEYGSYFVGGGSSSAFELAYDNATGVVSVTGGNFNAWVREYSNTGGNTAKGDNNYSLEPDIYFLENIEIISASNYSLRPTEKETCTPLGGEITYYDDSEMIIEKNILDNDNNIIETIYYDKNGNAITESEE